MPHETRIPNRSEHYLRHRRCRKCVYSLALQIASSTINTKVLSYLVSSQIYIQAAPKKMWESITEKCIR